MAMRTGFQRIRAVVAWAYWLAAAPYGCWALFDTYRLQPPAHWTDVPIVAGVALFYLLGGFGLLIGLTFIAQGSARLFAWIWEGFAERPVERKPSR